MKRIAIFSPNVKRYTVEPAPAATIRTNDERRCKGGRGRRDDDKKIVAAMKAYRDATGQYPRTEPFELAGVTKDFEAAAKKKLDAETLKGFVLVAVLQSLSKEAVYRGKSVGPEDASKILFRWKLNDGRYRVIFGDLKAETASAEKLKEMERK